ncbi:MAG: hypothetical protein RL380_506 [Verrucomicrobiota bacterium]
MKTILKISTALALATVVHAQTITLSSVSTKIWVGAGATNNVFQAGTALVASNTAAINSILNQVDFTVTNQPTGVTGVTATLTPSTLTLATPGTANASVVLTLFTTNVASGTYPLTLTATDDGNPRASTNLTLFAASQWNNVGTGNWSDGTQWTTGLTPTNTDNVFFEGGASVVSTVDSSRTIQSLISINNGDAANVTLNIPTNVVLSVVGTNGLVIANKNSNNQRNLNIYSGAGSLIVSNRSANFAVTSASGTTRGTTLAMSNLNSFVCDVNRIGVADLTLVQQGLYGAQLGSLHLARTNIIRTDFSDNYNAAVFNTAIQVTHEADAFSASGATTASQFLSLGISNAIFSDSISVGRSRSTGTGGGSVTPPYVFGSGIRFNPTLPNASATALFRGTNGGRMTLVGAGVDSGTPNAPNNAKGHVSLNGGTVDMMVEQIWLGRNRSNAVANTTIGGFYFDAGVVDANYVYAGYQFFTNAQGCTGYLCVSNTAVLKVNNLLTLGYSAGGGGEVGTTGQLLITNNGVVRANQIAVGAASGNNNISIGNGGNLSVTNTLAGADHKLSTLTMNAGSLTVRLDGNVTNSIYVTNLVCAGANNTINIGSLVNLPTLPATFSVIAYDNLPSGQNFVLGTAPAGYNATVSHNAGNKTVEIALSQGVPKTLRWRGFTNGNWDTTTANWLNTSNNLPATFATGDFTVFDDTAGVPTTVSVTENVTPGQSTTIPGIAMTNSTNNFVFTGSSILGSAGLSKAGTGSLEIQNHTEVSATISQGLLFGAGDLGGATVTANGAFNFSGIINGSVNTSSTNATSSGTINGSVAVQAGGSFTNLGTVTSSLSIAATALLHNGGTFNNVGSPTFPSNSVVINFGNIYGGNITVGGTLFDSGAGAISLGSSSVTNTLTINGGANFIPGGTGLGTTTCGDLSPRRTRVLLGNNSTNLFKVSPGVGSTLLNAFYLDFGANNTLNGGGGIILVTNVGAAYAAGQSFTLFTGVVGGQIIPAGTNTFPQISPLAPALGLAWDLSTIKTDGVLRIIAVNTNAPTIPLTLTSVPGYNTNSILINYTNISHLEWPADRIGWRLQWQQSTLSNGITTNWLNLYGSAFTNVFDVSETLSTNLIKTNCTFFRLIYP